MLDWFTTIPGILILCGVVLLIIAIILFILGNKKSKKEVTVSNESLVKENTIAENTEVKLETPEVASVQESVVEPVVEAPVQEPAIEIQEPVVTPTVEPVQEVTPAVEPVAEANSVSEQTVVLPTVEEPKPFEIPVVAPIEIPSAEATPAVEPVVEAPVQQPTIEIQEPVVTQIADTNIYGGVNPADTVEIQEEKAPTIYGGADPLEKTQSIKPVEEIHAPYSEPEIKIVEPMVQEVPTTMPEPQPTITIPEVQPAEVKTNVEEL